MSDQLIPLTLPVVDALAFAAVRGCLQTTLAESRNVYAADELGPLVEFLHAVRADDTIRSTDLVRLVTATGSLGEVLSGLVFGRPGCLAADGRLAGFYRTGSDAEGEEDEWISFLMAARRATTAAQFPAREGAQIVAAMRELRSNIDEHSGAPDSGIVAFKAGIPGHFEFVVADQGRGVLDSLRSSQEYGLEQPCPCVATGFGGGRVEEGPGHREWKRFQADLRRISRHAGPPTLQIRGPCTRYRWPLRSHDGSDRTEGDASWLHRHGELQGMTMVVKDIACTLSDDKLPDDEPPMHESRPCGRNR